MANFIDENTVFILDSYGLIFREYYAFFSRPLTDSKGQNISAVFGFFRNLSILIKNFKPKYFIAAMDSRTPTFRHLAYKDYKATRQKTPEELKAQFPMIEECLKVLGIPVLRVDGYEADDVVATIARQQLTNQNIHMLKPDKVKTWAEADEQDVENEWGLKPEKILDLLSLTGDSADNVPGVKGVGPKTAVKLLNEYGSLEKIYENADSIKGSIGEKIRSDKENAFLSKNANFRHWQKHILNSAKKQQKPRKLPKKTKKIPSKKNNFRRLQQKSKKIRAIILHAQICRH